MDKGYAGYLAIYNLGKYNLLEHGWKFRWHNKKVSLGTCNYTNKWILLSKWYVELNTEDEVKDTILHEIAHALAYQRHGRAGHGHGRIWKSICREIGARPERCSKDKLNRPKNHYKYIDTCCGRTYKKHRLRKNIKYSCPKCHSPVFVSKREKYEYECAGKLLKSIFE